MPDININENFGKWFISMNNEDYSILLLRVGVILGMLLLAYIGKKIVDKLLK